MRRWLAALGCVAAAISVAVAAAWWVPLPARLEARGSTAVLYDDGSIAHTQLAPDERWRIAVRLDEVDPAFVEALVLLEDKRFWVHPGVDPLAIARALWTDLVAGEVVSGASTLTMQLARLCEPRPRTVRSKLVEMARAVQLELRLSKVEILEAYLTLAPYGRNLEGLEAASLSIFGHRPDALSATEIATLLAIPQDPNGRYPHPDHAEVLQRARDDIAGRLLARGAFERGAGLTAEAIAQQVRAAPVPERLVPMPRSAPHAAAFLRAAEPASVRIPTHLQPGVQRLAERALGRARPQLARQGIHNAAVVIAEHDSGEVHGLVGNFDFFDRDHAGEIRGFDVPRSPGSALKPFVYGLAIDRGLALPEHLVADAPVRYGGYAPANYDGTFSGLVELEDALSRSLNIPFIELLAELGTEPVVGTLRAAGVRSLDPTPGHYGLSLVVGGAEITPLELTALYAALAGDGRVRPLALRAGPGAVPGPRLLEPGTAWLVRRALRLRDRPDFPGRAHLARVPRDIHWKTGTSYGHRDAWAVGSCCSARSGGGYTVAVWLGNQDMRASTHLVGATAAGPVLFDLLESLHSGTPPVDPAPPDLIGVEVCARSGRVPGPACERTRRVLALQHQVPTERCALHERVEVDAATGLRVTAACRAGRSTTITSAVQLPGEVRRYLPDPGAHAVPDWAPGCRPPDRPQPPRIVSPRQGATALLVPGLRPDEQEIPLQADAHSGALEWFVDGAWLGTASDGRPLWWTPRPGRHEVVVQDATGASDRVTLEVRRSL